MPITLNTAFTRANDTIDAAKSFAQLYASKFTTDSTRDEVMRTHQYCKQLVTDLTAAQAVASIDAYAAEQWPTGSPGFTTKTGQVITAAQDVLAWIQTNFPTYRSTLDIAMQALSITPAQQDALRSQLGTNLAYVLTHQIQSGIIVSPTLPAAALAPLVSLLNSLETAATMP